MCLPIHMLVNKPVRKLKIKTSERRLHVIGIFNFFKKSKVEDNSPEIKAEPVLTAEEWHQKGMENLGKDDLYAFECFMNGAKMNNCKSMRNLAVMYFKGQGVVSNLAMAAKWYEQAARFGDASSMRDIGIFYAIGQGVEKDEAKARYWFQKAIEVGDEKALDRMKLFGLD